MANKKEIEEMKALLADRIFEYNELRYSTCRDIEAKYHALFGEAEYQVQATKTELDRLKRKLTVVNNRQQLRRAIKMDFIEKELDNEFEDYYLHLEELRAGLARSEARLMNELFTEEEKKDFRTLLEITSRKINPEIKDLTEDEEEIYNRLIEVYREEKTEDLKEAVAEAEKLAKTAKDRVYESEEELNLEKERLENKLRMYKMEIAKLKLRYPYIDLEVMDDPELVEKKLMGLQKVIDEYKGLMKYSEEAMDKLMEKEKTIVD